MIQKKRRQFLIQELIKEEPRYRIIRMPDNESEEKKLLRSLMNVRPAKLIDSTFLEVQDAYIQEELMQKGITSIADLSPVQKDIYLWQGDITTLKCGAIVNAANSCMTGCYVPCHACIDNCIHTYAGIQLRNYCNEIMEKQGYGEPTGTAKLTPAFNLPCDYVIHTVGPIVYGELSEEHCKVLESCYRSCLELADKSEIESIAFCCISTGEFHFPNEEAAKIAVKTVRYYKKKTNSKIKVIFNVFKDYDREIYERLLR